MNRLVACWSGGHTRKVGGWGRKGQRERGQQGASMTKERSDVAEAQRLRGGWWIMKLSGPSELCQVLLGHELAFWAGKRAALAAFLCDRRPDQSWAMGRSLRLCCV